MVDANQDMGAQKELNQPEAQKTSSKDQENSKDVQNNQAVTQDNSGSAEAKKEKLIPQSEVDKLVYAKKMEGYERGQRETLANANTEKNLAASVDENDPNKVLIDRNELAKIVNEESARLSEQQRAQATINQFVAKVQAGSAKYSDYDGTVAKLNLQHLPPSLVEITNAMDNTADVLYELGKNPSKFSSVLNLCNASPQLAYDEITRLSSSIKKNEEAAKQNAQVKVNEPLDQVKPSTTGTDSGRLETVKDFMNHPDLRG